MGKSNSLETIASGLPAKAATNSFAVMGATIAEKHLELYHYTGAAGLEGIVREQVLRATNIGYLNDAEERTGFFERRLRHLLREPIEAAFLSLSATAEGRRIIAEGGGEHRSKEDLFRSMHTLYTEASLRFDEAFVTSFCGAPSHDTNDGLLSQWRGYGADGGYAIVFETAAINMLIENEQYFHYQHFSFGDMQYFSGQADEKSGDEDTIKFEGILRKATQQFVLGGGHEVLEPTYEAATILSCLFKHRGFSEESEVRIVAIPTTNEIYDIAYGGGDTRPRRPVQFRSRGGDYLSPTLTSSPVRMGFRQKICPSRES